MKINWATGLVIGMALFIAFILYFVIRISTDSTLDHDLVTEKYYQKEMELQDDIYAQQNVAAIALDMTNKKTTQGYLITFPESFAPQNIKGTVFLYRPSNKQLDFSFPIEMENSNLLIPNKRLLDGRWNIRVDWEYEGKKYQYRNQITY